MTDFKLKSYKQPESAVVKQVKQYLAMRGWLVIRIHQGLGCHKGISDLVATKGGQTVWIECKTSTGRLSPYQEQFRAAMEKAGGVYWVARALQDAIDIDLLCGKNGGKA